MLCPECKHKNTAGSLFCGNCGNKLPESDISLPVIDVWLTLLYSVISLGFYVPAWFLTRLKTINAMSTVTKINSGWLMASIVLNVFSVAGSIIYSYIIFVNGGVTMEAIMYYTAGSIAALFMALILIVEAYKVMQVFDEYYNVKLGQGVTFSKGWVLVGNILYLQYKINKLPK